MKLKGKTAIVTGASGKLGSEIVRDLTSLGCNCICQYQTNVQTVQQIIEKTKNMGANVKAVKADITKKSDLQNLIEKARQLQNFQILINSAAVFEKSELKNLDFPQAGRIMNINFTSAVVLSKLFAEHIQKQKNLTGKIINISDIAGINPWSGYSFYCASKAALISAGKSLAKELAPSITVNTIAPGLIDIPEDYDQSEIERQLNFIPLKRKGERADITSTVHFLIENDYITGQVIHIDGGRTL